MTQPTPDFGAMLAEVLSILEETEAVSEIYPDNYLDGPGGKLKYPGVSGKNINPILVVDENKIRPHYDRLSVLLAQVNGRSILTNLKPGDTHDRLAALMGTFLKMSIDNSYGPRPY